jgi:CRP-like cAMP-binding protein
MSAARSFLNRVPQPVRKRLVAIGKLVTLDPGDTLARIGSPTRHVCFPLSGAMSVGAQVGQSTSSQLLVAGSESIISGNVLLGMHPTPLDATVVTTGTAHIIEVRAYLRLLAIDTVLLRMHQKAIGELLSRLGRAAVCMQHHLLPGRLARVLLELSDREMTDRVNGHSLLLTHETLAWLLGVRREGISLQAAQLQQRGLIAYKRGLVTLTDRKGLQKEACSCYQASLDRPGRMRKD